MAAWMILAQRREWGKTIVLQQEGYVEKEDSARLREPLWETMRLRGAECLCPKCESGSMKRQEQWHHRSASGRHPSHHWQPHWYSQ